METYGPPHHDTPKYFGDDCKSHEAPPDKDIGAPTKNLGAIGDLETIGNLILLS